MIPTPPPSTATSTSGSRSQATFILYTGSSGPGEALRSLDSSIEVRAVLSLTQVDPGGHPAVLVLSAEMDLAAGVDALPSHVVVIAADDESRGVAERAGRFFLATADVTSLEALLRALRGAAHLSGSLLSQARAAAQLGSATEQLKDLNRIGLALMSERDPDSLLGLILTHARRVTSSDAGSLYLVEEQDGERRLHFLRAQNDSIPGLTSPDFSLPMDPSSIAGYAASSGEPLVIDDVYDIPDDAPYTFNRGFDLTLGYRAKSMLTVPMKDHRNRVVGVLQLINRKRIPTATIRGEADVERHVLPYTKAEVDVVASLAGQAAVSIENGKLYQDIENLFEGFIKAAVTAIDQRDPTTSGHSVRVASLTCDLAELVDRASDGPFKQVRFTREQMRELRYAGLLHDFGKVAVREEVLVKAKKLPTLMQERVRARFELIEHALQAEFLRQKSEYLLECGRDGFDAFMGRLEREFSAERGRLERYRSAVIDANEPKLVPVEEERILQEIAGATFRDWKGGEIPYIKPEELHFLSIPRGSLDPGEREQIQSHVMYTYDFLRQIPWTEDLARVVDIAFAHHEALDGTGYPRGISGDQIPLQTRMMTVSDVFDALTASDRPYKKSIPAEDALDILRTEAAASRLDSAVVQVLVESRVYERILREDWRKL